MLRAVFMPSFQTNWLRLSSVRPAYWLALLSLLSWTAGPALGQDGKTTPVSARLFSAVPMAFEQNQGQLPAGVSFLGRAQNYSVAIEPDRLQFMLPESTVDVRFAGSRGGAPVSLSGVAYRSNYFIGADRSKWREGVANFSRVGVRGVYPGIDTEFYEKNGELEHDFVVAPGADADSIRLDLESKQQAKLTADGDAVIPASTGEIRFRKPVAYQFDAQGRRVAVDAAYRLTGKSLRFALGSYDHSRTLVIDPVIVFATYVSGSAGSTPAQMATDGNGTLFLTGTTTSISGFPPSAASTDHSGSGASNVFVAALTTSQLGSALQWITYLGNTGASTATSIAYSANNSGTVYVGGTTTKGNFPGTQSGAFEGTFPDGAASQTSFVTTLTAAGGASPNSTYICTGCASAATAPGVVDATTVTSLAADGSGNVYIAGYGPGTVLPVTANSLGGTSVLPTTAGANNAFVIELNPTLSAASLVTYLQDPTGTGVHVNYQATAIAVDAGSPANIYVAGTAGGISGTSDVVFPTIESFPGDGTYTAGKNFAPCTRTGTNTSVFLAQIKQATHDTLGFSMLTCSDTTSGSDTARGLAVSADGLYLVGDTLSHGLANNLYFTNAANTTAKNNTITGGLQDTFAAGNINGYAVQIPISSGAVQAPAAFTFLGGTSAGGNTTVYSVAIDSTNHLVQLAGQTAATRATMPGAPAAGLPAASQQDLSGNAVRAFLYTFEDSSSPPPAALSGAALKSISYLGNATTASKAVSVAADTNGAGAFVVVQDTDGASGFGYSPSAAAGTAAANQTNAYLADIQGTNVAAASTGLSFVKSTDSPQVDGTPCNQLLACLIDYVSGGDFSTILYKWDLKVPNAPASNVVLDFPAQPALASGSSPAYTIQLDGASIECASNPSSNGTTCTVPSLSAGSHTVTLQGTTNATAVVGTAFSFDGSAADAEGEFSDGQQNQVTVAAPVSITTTLTQSIATIDAAASAADTGSAGHTTVVLYTATVTNTSANDSKYTALKITLPPAFRVTTAPTVSGAASSTCDLTGGTGCTKADLPAGATLTYTFAGVYLGSALTGQNADGTFTETVKADATALPHTANSTASANVETTVHGYAALSLSVTSDKGTYNLSTAAAPDIVTYKITVANGGPNASGPITAAALTNTLPANFTVTGIPNPPDASCRADGTGCDKLPSIPANGSAIYTVTGTFPDNGINPDAVPPTVASAQAADTASFTPPATTYNPNTATPQTLNVTVQRKSDLTLSGAVTVLNASPSAPCDKAPGTAACVYMANTGGVNGIAGTGINDNPQYTVTIQNAGPNLATAATVTIPLPTGFQGPITATSSTGLTCPPAAGSTVTCTGYVPVSGTNPSTVVFSSKFADNTVPAPPPPPGAKFITTNPPANSVTIAAAVVGANNPGQLPNVTVERAAHLVTLKYVCRSAGIANPAQPCPATPGTVNLDEQVANNAPGRNDLVQVQLQIGNTQLDAAYGVAVSDPLPNYFTITQLPDPAVATCTITGTVTRDPATGDYKTGAAAAALSCSLNNPIPVGTATPGTSATSHGVMVPNSGYAQLTYYGKFQDNGLNPDIVPPTSGSISPALAQAQASSSLAVLADTVGDATSPVPAPLTVQRAAHLHFTLTQYVQPGDIPLNPVGGPVPGSSISPGIAEAQPGINGGLVINPVRYQVKVTNDGPNIAIHPIVNTTLPVMFVNVTQQTEPSPAPGSQNAGCSGQTCQQDVGMIATGASALYNVDGNFGLNTLTEGNAGTRTFASAIADSSVVDSNMAATQSGDQQTSAPITVVNTPAGSNFSLLPFDSNLATPLNLKVNSVQVAGVTSLVPSAIPALPSGPSPYPPDGGATKPLYQFAQGGAYYTLGTTAGVSTASSNPTTICLSSIPGTFQKPERVLMWALSNAPAGTAFGTVPHYTNNGSAGDITISVTPLGGGNYTVPGPITSYPPPVEPQPAQVCGVLNGLADAANPTTLAVLEPVNFAPYVRSTIAPASTQYGKGVTAGAALIDLTIAPDKNYDYNDADPCYAGDGGKRTTCNDNVQLTTFLFGGQNLIGDSQQQHSYFYSELQPGTNPPQFNLPAGGPQVYVLLADNLAAQKYPAINNDPLHPLGCDPGTLSATYTPSVPACTDKPALSTVENPPQQLPLTDNPSATVALVGNNALFGGSAGLIAITAPPIPEATAHITAGQTAGFVWNLLTENPLVQGNPLPNFTLTCQSADGKDLASVGIKCSVSPTYVYSTISNGTAVITAPPTVYVSTSSNTAVGALQEAPLSRDLRIVAAVVFPVGAIPLVLLLRRRRALKLSGWLAVMFLASLVGLGIGCGSNSSFNNQGGTTTTGTTAGSYEFVIVASGTDGSGNPINIKSPAFAVTVSAVH